MGQTEYNDFNDNELPANFHLIYNAAHWDECVMVLAEDYKEGLTYRDAAYAEAGISSTAGIR